VATAGSATSSAAPAAGFVPTALGFQVSPYLNPDRTAGDTNLNTLNYLMMSNNDVMPPAMPAISWNWIDPTQDEEKTKAGMELKFHGVLATRRNVFAQALGQVLNPASASLKGAPKISGTGKNWLMTINTSPT